MSSNLRIIKICESCKQEFVARKTTTQTCSDAYAKRLYKVKKRNGAISRAKLDTEIKREPETYITQGQVGEVKKVHAKDLLSHEQ